MQAVVLLAIGASVPLAGASREQLILKNREWKADVPALPGKALSVAYEPDGGIGVVTLNDVRAGVPRVYRYRPGWDQFREIRFDSAVAKIPGGFQMLPNLTVADGGTLYLPVVSLDDGVFHSYVLRIAEGASETIALRPAVEIRRVAVTPDGGLLVLGIDGGFFRGRESACALLHQYTPDGQRLQSFSPCPSHNLPGGGATRRDGVDFELLKRDTDLGQVWLSAGRVHHLLPYSRELRVFHANGALERSVQLEAPAGPDGELMTVRLLLPLRDGRAFVVWASRRQAGAVISAHGAAAMHAIDGRRLSELTTLQQLHGLAPAYVDSRGQLVFATTDPRSGRQSHWTAELALQ